MVLFIVTLVIFLVVLFYLAIVLSLILRSRGCYEEYEYVLRKAYDRRYNLALGATVYLSDEVSRTIDTYLKGIRGGISLKEEFELNNAFASLLDTIAFSESDSMELGMLSLDIDRKVDAYNKKIDEFNSFVFSILVRPVSKLCHVKKMEKLLSATPV